MSADWAIALCTTFMTISIAFWGWLAVKVIGQDRKIAELEAKIVNRENICGERYEWLQGMDKRLQSMAVNIAGIAGKLGVIEREDV